MKTTRGQLIDEQEPLQWGTCVKGSLRKKNGKKRLGEATQNPKDQKTGGNI